jgi:hypothetical protein
LSSEMDDSNSPVNINATIVPKKREKPNEDSNSHEEPQDSNVDPPNNKIKKGKQ